MKDGLKKDGLGKDGLSKEILLQDGFSQDGFSKDGLSRDGHSKDGSSRDGFSKDGALHLLTEREKEVLSILSNGFTNKETAKKLDISVRTVETHRKNIMQKLNINNIAGLIKFAIANNLTLLD